MRFVRARRGLAIACAVSRSVLGIGGGDCRGGDPEKIDKLVKVGDCIRGSCWSFVEFWNPSRDKHF